MIKNSPLISVIIPCYNAEQYVEQAVCSIMNQTYSNLEILCCDDCSTDLTLSILEKLASEDRRIRIIRHKENKKLIFTLNELVQESSGDFIARMDADDISLPERLEKQLNFLQENPDISFCGTNAWHINEEGKRIGKSCLPLTPEDNRFFLPFYSTFYHPTIMARAEVFKNNPYDKDFIHAEDYELWCRLVFERGMKGCNLSQKFFLYRINSKGISVNNRQNQLETGMFLVDKYGLCPIEYSSVHKGLFFHSNSILSKNNIQDYLNILIIKFKTKNKQFVYIPYLRVLNYLLWNEKALFIKYSCTAMGFYTIIKRLGR